MCVAEDYFKWLYGMVEAYKYEQLLHTMHDVPFKAIMEMDQNRICDALDMRYDYASGAHIPKRLMDVKVNPNEVSVLEVMIALAVRMEVSILEDEELGDRTHIWFEDMINSLDLQDMTDGNCEPGYVVSILETFINREYDYTGKGGLFTVSNTNEDLSKLDIWRQMLLYTDEMLGL